MASELPIGRDLETFASDRYGKIKRDYDKVCARQKSVRHSFYSQLKAEFIRTLVKIGGACMCDVAGPRVSSVEH